MRELAAQLPAGPAQACRGRGVILAQPPVPGVLVDAHAAIEASGRLTARPFEAEELVDGLACACGPGVFRVEGGCGAVVAHVRLLPLRPGTVFSGPAPHGSNSGPPGS